MLGLKLIRFSKEAPGYKHLTIDSIQVQKYLGAQAAVSRVHYEFLADLLWFSGVMLTYHISGHQVIFWKSHVKIYNQHWTYRWLTKPSNPDVGLANKRDTWRSLLLTWININPSMDKYSHAQKSVGWNYLSIPKLQRLHRWSLGMDKWFHRTLYNGCNNLSMLGLKLIHVS